MRKKLASVSWVVWLYLVLLVVVSAVYVSLMWPKWVLPSRLEEMLPAELEAIGLEDVSVSAGRVRDDKLCLLDIYCSNWSEYSYGQMYSMHEKIDDVADDVTDRAVDGYFGAVPWNIYCNGDQYRVYTSTRSIYLNGEQVHDDYWNSDSHKSVVYGDDFADYDYTPAVKADAPYYGMPAIQVTKTKLGAPDEVEKCKDYYALRPERRTIKYRWNDADGMVLFAALTMDGKVISVTDFRK